MLDNNQLLISVIIPVYNREKTLEETLASILAQELRPLEIILVNNMSKDSSLSICEKFKEDNQNENFKVVVLNESKPGANASRNKGVKHATGDYFYFFDSDDILYPGALEAIYRNLYIKQFPEVLLFRSHLKLTDNKRTIRPNRFSANPECQLYNPVVTTHGAVLKRTLIEKTGLWDKDIFRWQDLEFGFRVLLFANNVKWIKTRPLYEIRYHKDSISGNSYTKDHLLLNTSLEKIKKTIESIDNTKQKVKCDRALCFKYNELACEIKKDNKQISKMYYKKSLDLLPEKGRDISRILLNLNYILKPLGIRGSWRFYEKIFRYL